MIGCLLEITGNGGGNAVTRLAETFGVQTELLVAQIVNFCLVTYLLYRFAVKPTLKTVEARQKKIEEGLRFAEEMKAKQASAERERLEVLKKAQVDAQALLASTKAEGERYLAEQKKAAEEKVLQLTEQARHAMEGERSAMLKEAKAEIATLTVATTERLLSGILTDDMRAKLNEQAAALLAQSKDKHGTQA
jgi:F-type H+-transporting ATPase subunit b